MKSGQKIDGKGLFGRCRLRGEYCMTDPDWMVCFCLECRYLIINY